MAEVRHIGMSRPLFLSSLTAGAILICCGSYPAVSRSALPGASSAQARNPIYTPDRLETELATMVRRFPAHLRIERIGQSAQGRSLSVVELGPRTPDSRPTVFILFGQHPDEHDVNSLGMFFIRELVAGYGHDAGTTTLLDRFRVAIMPMANPDGCVHDLEESATPFAWRRNRRPHDGGIGTNLNRNWGHTWKPGHEEDWPGEAAFSEPESRAIRDWLMARGRIAGLFDFHTGTSSFTEGMVLIPEPEWLTQPSLETHDRIARLLAENMSLPGDRRDDFWVCAPSAVRGRLVEALTRIVPEPHRAEAIARLPADTRAWGTSLGWASNEFDTVSLGLEISRTFETTDVPAYGRAMQADHATRAPRFLWAFVTAAIALPVSPR